MANPSHDLLPCPFCGGPAELRKTPNMHMVECANADCGSNPDVLQVFKHDAIAAWNRRATPPSPSTAPEVDERAAFEAWVTCLAPGHPLARNPNGRYSADCNEWAWDGWKARAALASRPAEVDAVRLLREARAALETWKDVAPAVSLCADIDKVLAGGAR